MKNRVACKKNQTCNSGGEVKEYPLNFVVKPLGKRLLGRRGNRFQISIKVDLRESGEGEKEIGFFRIILRGVF
jgi:hypothetical protein